MSMKVSIAMTVSTMDDNVVAQVVHGDTSINPNPLDEAADVLLAARLVEHLVTVAGRQMEGRLTEFGGALDRFMKSQSDDSP